jgi:four helix bundle protein
MREQGNTIYDKSFAFAKRIVRLYRFLGERHREYTLSKQLLRCGTSIGANVHEAVAAQSKKEFIAKMSIASKEARETEYWISLLIETGFLDGEADHVASLRRDIDEIVRILSSIVKTSQQNLQAERTQKG